MSGRKVLLGTIVLLFFCTKNLKAQVASSDSLLTKAFITDELLPHFIDSALKYSPEIKRLSSITTSMKENLQIAKKNIFSAINVNSSYNYGTNFTALNTPTGGGATNTFTTAQTGFYNVGVGLQLPITSILNRKNQLKSGKAQVDMANAQVDGAALLVKQDVIRLYQEMKLAFRLLTISTKSKQSAQINYTMLEKDFVQGQATVVQLSSVLEIANKAVVDYETNLIRFQTAIMTMEAYTNVNLLSLLKLVK
ncbi:MAG: hypothetical protein RLY16_108 [Bacteroidota bacterium]|jgi:outer membrane protein TolC